MIRGTGTMQGEEYARIYVPGAVDEDLPVWPGEEYTVQVPRAVDAIVILPGAHEYRVTSIEVEAVAEVTA